MSTTVTAHPGKDALSAAGVLAARTRDGRSSRSLMLSGPGADQTLDQIATILAAAGWPTVVIDPAAIDALPTLLGLPGSDQTGIFGLDLDQALTIALAAAPAGTGVAVLVHDVHQLRAATCEALLIAQHQAAGHGRAFYLFGTGPANLPVRLTRVRGYADRQFDYYRT